MKFVEEVKDILDVPKKYFICHASSSDLDMRYGLAKVINNTYDLVDGLKLKYDEENIYSGGCFVVGNVITLMVKNKSSDSVDTYDLECSLQELREQIREEGIRHIAFPKICCGNMGMKWSDVKTLIKTTFENFDLDILICHESESDIVPDVGDMENLLKNNYDNLSDNAKVALFESTKEYLSKNIYSGIKNTGGF